VSVRVLPIAVVLALAALLAGCGGEAGSGDLDSLLGEGWRAYGMGNFGGAHSFFDAVAQDERASDQQLYSSVLGLAVTALYQTTPDLNAARQYYERLATVHVDGAVAQSMLGIGNVYIAQEKSGEAQVELANLVRQFPDSEEADEATLLLADCLFRPTPDDKAVGGYRLASPALVQRGINALEDRLRTHPNTSLAPVLHMVAASRLVDMGSYREAIVHLQAALELGVESSTIAGTLTWQIARIADKELHDYALAEKYYADFVAHNKRNQLYYLAMLSEKRMQQLLAEKPKE
jgi:tetratricopeptide (TPR) repeat protein